MPDREKVIKGLLNHVYGHPHTRCHKCPYWGTGAHGSSECTVLFADALALLKEQEAVVRCKDCKHRPKEIPFTTSWGGHDTYLEFPEGSRCPGQCSGDSYYSWKPDDDWFCADGEKRTD